MIKLVSAFVIVAAGALLAMRELRGEPHGGKLRWFLYALVVLPALANLVAEYVEYRGQKQAERESIARHDELIRADRSSGTLLPPTIGAQSDVMELTIGNNTLTCSARHGLDLAQVLNKLAPFPLAAEGPYLRVVNGGDRLWVSATLTDKNGSILGILHDNAFIFEPRRDLSVSPSPNQVIVRDTDQTTLLDVLLTSAYQARVRGVFYTPSYRCVMDDNGIVCDAVSDKAPIRHIEISGNKMTVLPPTSKPAE